MNLDATLVMTVGLSTRLEEATTFVSAFSSCLSVTNSCCSNSGRVPSKIDNALDICTDNWDYIRFFILFPTEFRWWLSESL